MKSAPKKAKKSGASKRKAAPEKAVVGIPPSSKQYASPIAEREAILAVINSAGRPLTYEHLVAHFGYQDSDEKREALRRRLVAMCRDAQLIRNRRQGFVPVQSSDLIVGHISAHPDGFGFLVADEQQSDIYLNATQMRQVLHGDKAIVCITGADRRGRKEGRITDVLERANSQIVGRLVKEQGVTLIVADNKRIHLDLLIPPGELGGARNGDMVVADIVEQPGRRHPPVGRVAEVLGEHLMPGMEIDVAIHSHGIPNEWPEVVSSKLSKFKNTVPEKDKKDRRDVRDVPLVTIDGADARDFDDAVYCEKTDTGWRLFVAIADVSHYVKAGSALDAEALQRGTSVYFPGRVVPMLPEELSNGLCSLNPDVDRLCMLCVMSLNDDGTLKRTRFQRAVMRSHARLTYDQANAIVAERDKDLRKQHRALAPHLDNLYRLYKVLAKQRRKRGAIEFESNESRIEFDADRKINAIVPVERNDAHRLIEECMILANVATAGFLQRHKLPALYRVHHGPQAVRLDDLRSFLALRGLRLGGGDSPAASDFAALAKRASKLPDASVIHTVMLRSMQAAVYQPLNEGHFGLSLDHYAHFTSPIRRYPDLLVHRAIGHVIDGGKAGNYRYTPAEMAQLGESCSMTERRAEEATRDVESWLKCEYMMDHIGEVFPGVISSVTSFGLFVRLEGNGIEGLAHITSLGRDYYHFDQAAHTLTGERTGATYSLGDSLSVKVAAVNLDERKIDFQTTESAKEGRRSRKRSEKQPEKHPEKRRRKRSEKNTVKGAQGKRAGDHGAGGQSVSGQSSGGRSLGNQVSDNQAAEKKRKKRKAKPKRKLDAKAKAKSNKSVAVNMAGGKEKSKPADANKARNKRKKKKPAKVPTSASKARRES